MHGGTDIFDDEVALDVRDSIDDALNEGLSTSAATERVLQEWGDAVEDMDDGPIIWFALAAIQLDRGDLQSDVRRHALAAIDDGANLQRWEGGEPEYYAERHRVSPTSSSWSC